jgi:hypothetical protein
MCRCARTRAARGATLRAFIGIARSPDRRARTIGSRRRIMPSVHRQQCPLCGEPAPFVYESGGTEKHFHCARCVEFVISNSAESMLTCVHRAQARRYTALSRERDRVGKVLKIDTRWTYERGSSRLEIVPTYVQAA